MVSLLDLAGDRCVVLTDQLVPDATVVFCVRDDHTGRSCRVEGILISPPSTSSQTEQRDPTD